MTATALSGILAFGPQPIKDTMAHQSVDTVVAGGLLQAIPLTGSPQATFNTGLQPLPGPSFAAITLTGGSLSATFTVNGTKFGETTASSEAIALLFASSGVGTSVWESITSIDLPAGSGKTAYIGYRQAPVIMRHRAADIDLSAIDDVRLGPNEIGGKPVPTFPYKAGQQVGGGATLYPRLENSLAWIIWAAMGYHNGERTWNGGLIYLDHEGTPDVSDAALIHADITLTAGTQAITTAFTQPTPDPARIAVLFKPAGAAWLAGDVVVTGTDSADAPQTETLYFSGGSELGTMLQTTALFKTVTQVDLPVRAQANDEVSVGYAMWNHVFTYNPVAGLEACIPWMTFYKYIPSGSCDPDAADALWELYEDCKVLGTVFTLPNNGPMTARFDVLGRKWAFSDSQPMTYLKGYEDYQSIPIGCHTGGGIKIPTYSNDELKVVSAQIGMVNAPLDVAQEKVIGSPDLEDVTVVSRSMSIDMVLKWVDADLYRRIYTGSITGTEWTEKPFVESAEIITVSNDNADDVNVPYELKFEAPTVLFQIPGGVRLAGNQAVMVRLTGTALDPGAGEDYFTLTLKNRQQRYHWPIA
jgi:hypothetical protein